MVYEILVEISIKSFFISIIRETVIRFFTKISIYQLIGHYHRSLYLTPYLGESKRKSG